MKNKKDLLKYGIMFLVNLMLKLEFQEVSIKNFLVKIQILVLVLKDGAVFFKMQIVTLKQIYFNRLLNILKNQLVLSMMVKKNLKLLLIILEQSLLHQQMVHSLIIMVVVMYFVDYYVVVFAMVRIQVWKDHFFINWFQKQQRL